MSSDHRRLVVSVLVVSLGGALAGCSQSETTNSLSGSGAVLAARVVRGRVTTRPTGVSVPVARPGTGSSSTTNPSVPAPTPVPNPPPTSVSKPTSSSSSSSSSSGLTKRQTIEKDYGVTITGKDAEVDQYLETTAAALSLYPKLAHKGLQITLDIQSLSVTGGIGGFWTLDAGKPKLTVYQATKQYVHIIIHELAHNFDMWTYSKRISPDLLNAATENGQIPEENIPSPYARYGLQNQNSGKLPEYGAECLSWSLDTTAIPGFSTYATWKPRKQLVDRLGKYLESDKIIWNQR